jgi:adenylate cyclase
MRRRRAGTNRRPFGSWLLGRDDGGRWGIELRTRIMLTLAIVVANVIGAVVVFVLAAFVVPVPEVDDTAEVIVLNLVVAGAYVLFAVPVGTVWGNRAVRPRVEWAFEERPPTEREQRRSLRLPMTLVRVQATLWSLAVVLFTVMNAVIDPDLTVYVLATVAAAGIVVCANAYLLSEFVLRPLTARALAARPPERPVVPGVTARALIAWTLGTGVPVVGLMGVAVANLAGEEVSDTRLSITILGIGGAVLVFGLGLAVLAARATADPVKSVRAAMNQVEQGRLDVELPVYDGSEIGLLQAGFNKMAAGLRDRERVRDLFGRHVGEDVARAALEGDVELGGEVREVAVLFVDIVGSTELAAKRPPEEVVELLNRFFAVVVDVVTECGGLINKFEGDAALAVFGAPIEVEDPAGHALKAARGLATRLRDEVPDLAAGIGVAAGPAVAGNIGEERRYEYTVIGDPVNEAARLTEHAKSVDGLVAASGAAVDRAGDEEAAHWKLDGEVELRGRSEATRLAVPA